MWLISESTIIWQQHLRKADLMPQMQFKSLTVYHGYNLQLTTNTIIYLSKGALFVFIHVHVAHHRKIQHTYFFIEQFVILNLDLEITNKMN